MLLHLQIKEIKLQRVILCSLLSSHCHTCVCGVVHNRWCLGGGVGFWQIFLFAKLSSVPYLCNVFLQVVVVFLLVPFSKIFFFQRFFLCYTYKNVPGYILWTSARSIYRKAEGPGNRLSQHKGGKECLIKPPERQEEEGEKGKVFPVVLTGAVFTFVLVQIIFL